MLAALLLAVQGLQAGQQSEEAEAWASAATYGRPTLAEVCCTAESVLGTQVQKMGGEVSRYSSWSGHDLTTRAGALKLLAELRTSQPRHVWFSPPCGPESPMQNLNQRDEAQRLALARKRHRVHRIQRHILMIIHNLRHLPIETHVEQPMVCGSRRRGLQPLVKDRERHLAAVDGCTYGLKGAKTGIVYHKRW